MCRWFDSAPGRQEYSYKNADLLQIGVFVLGETFRLSGLIPGYALPNQPHHLFTRIPAEALSP